MSAAQRSRYRKLRAGASDESGSALLIALVMIFVVAILATAVLSYTGTSLTATKSVRDDRANLYAADGALDTAIQNIKNADPLDGLGYNGGDPCALSVPGVAPAPTVTVDCAGATEASALGVGDGGNLSNQPKFAIQTLGRRSNQAGPPNKDINNFSDILAFWANGSAAEPGLVFSPSFSNAAGVAKLKGGVFSNSTIVADTGTLQTDPDTTFGSRQGCSVSRGGAIIVEGSATNPNCTSPVGYPGPGGYGADADASRNDPRFTSRADLQGIPTNKPALPTCTGTLLTFSPGWYDNAKALSDLTRTCKGPDNLGADFWFQPGLYYFDFRDGTATTCANGGGSQFREWCVGDQKGNPRIVGGTPLGWDPTPSASSPAFNPTAATSTNFTNPASGAVIDGTSATANPYSSGSSAMKATGDDGGSFTSRNLAYAISSGAITDSNAAKYTASCTFGCSANVVLRSFPTIPADAVPSSATLSIRHRESNTGVSASVDILSASNAVICSQSQTVTTASNPAVSTWNLPANCLDTAAKVNGVKVRYNVSAPFFSGTRSFWLDGAELTVNWATATGRSITVSGFNASVPSDAANLSATLTVEHSESAGTSPQVVLSPGGGACTFTPGVGAMNVAACLNTPAKFTNLTATYSATLGANKNASLDGMRLNVSYTAASRPTFPGACDPDAPGVQFVFAGDSRVRFVDGTANLCAGPPPGSVGQAGYSAQRIAIYGNREVPTLPPSTATPVGSGVTNPANAVIMAEQPTNTSSTISWSSTLFSPKPTSPGTLRMTVPGLAAAGYPSLPANTKITKVEMRAQYNTRPDFWGTLFGFAPTLSARIVPPGGVNNVSTCFRSGLQSNSGQALEDWGEPKLDTLDVTDCFRTNQTNSSTAVDVAKLANVTVDWQGNVSCFFGCDPSVDVDGLELVLTLGPIDNNAPAALPAQGCITAKPNYGRGNNGGDDKSCAVLRWGSSDGLASGTTDLFNQIFGNDPNAPSTMVSMSGTVYAPSAAIDVAEYGRYCQQTRKNRFLWWVWDACDGTNANAFSGVNYPVVDRGIIARTVRIRGLKVDPEYTDYVVGCGRDDCGNTTVPNAKLVTLQAKIDATTRITAQVCFGPIKTVGVDGYTTPAASEAQIGTSTRYCTGDGSGDPVVATWRDERAQT